MHVNTRYALVSKVSEYIIFEGMLNAAVRLYSNII